MPEQAKPSAGALRAATAIGKAVVSPETYAQVIDRETGVAELLEAAKDAFDHLEIYRRAVKYSARDMGNAVSARLEQAIAKAERGA